MLRRWYGRQILMPLTPLLSLSQVLRQEEGGCSVVGVDVIASAVDECRAHASAAGVAPECKFMVADVFRLQGSGDIIPKVRNV